MLALRDYQREAMHAILREWGYAPFWDGERKTARTTVCSLATSAGKTLIAAHLSDYLVREHGARVLFCGDRRELIDQPVEKFAKACGIHAAVHSGNDKASPNASVVIGSVQTLVRRLPAGRPFTHIISDEAHRYVEGRHKIHEAYPDAKVLGITATNFRRNTADLSEWFETICFDLGTFDLIQEGYITPIKALTLPLKVDLTGVRQKSGDFDQEQVAGLLVPQYRAIAAAIKEHAPERSILAFLPLIQSSVEFAQVMREEGLTAMHCDGSTGDRKEVLAQFERGDFQILSNSQVFSTGTDFIRCSALLNLAVTRSRGEFRQRAGRIMRLLPGVIDPGGVTLPTADHRRAAIAASAKPDCVAEGTLVMTDHGEIPIEYVTKSMMVWDGTCYRKHGGAIFRGEKETITYAGLTATPNHQVWIGEKWLSFEEAKRAAIPISATAYGGATIQESQSCFFRVSENSGREIYKNANGVHDVPQNWMEVARASIEWRGWVQKMRNNKEGDKNTEMVAVPCIWTKATMHESQIQNVQKLWGAWNSIQIPERLRGVRVDYRHSWNSKGEATGSHRQRWALRTRKSEMVYTQPKFIPYTQNGSGCEISSVPFRASRGSVCGHDAIEDDWTRHDIRSDSSAMGGSIHKAKRRVWDIYNCGPLHRFTANGLLVHNCVIIDCLWQTAKIGLAGPASILATSEAEEEQFAEVIRKKRSPEDLLQISEDFRRAKEEQLRAELEAQSRQQAADATRRATLLDARSLMLDLHDRELTNYEPTMPWEAKPIAEWQVQKLELLGYDPSNVSCAGLATKLLDAVNGRESRGLAAVEAFGALREHGAAEPASVTLNEAIRILGDRYPMVQGKRHHGVPLRDVPKGYWSWLMQSDDIRAIKSRQSLQWKSPSAYRYYTKVVFLQRKPAPVPVGETAELL